MSTNSHTRFARFGVQAKQHKLGGLNAYYTEIDGALRSKFQNFQRNDGFPYANALARQVTHLNMKLPTP
jgi:hypothetical protein